MVKWTERQQCLSTPWVSSILQYNEVRKNHFYVKSIVDIVHFFCAKNLSFQENQNDASEDEKRSIVALRKMLFKYTVEKVTRLNESYITILKNANSTS